MATSLSQTAPSTAAIAVSTAIISLLVGYFLGQGASLGLFGSPLKKKTVVRERLADKDADEDEDEDEAGDSDESEDELQNVIEYDANEEYKMVLVVRVDLGMNKGTCYSYN